MRNIATKWARGPLGIVAILGFLCVSSTPLFGDIRPPIRWMVAGHDDGAFALAMSPDNSLFALGGFNDNVISIWRTSDLTTQRTILGHSEFVTSLQFTPDGSTLISGGRDGTVKFWNIPDGTLIRSLPAMQDVQALAISPNGSLLAVCGNDGTYPNWRGIVRIYRLSDGALLHTLTYSTREWAHVVCFSPDGQFVFAGGGGVDLGGNPIDCYIRIWRVSDGTLLRTLTGHNDPIVSLDCSPDGAYLASASEQDDNRILVWRTSDWTLSRSFVEPNWNVQVRFSPDGQFLSSISGFNETRTIKLRRTSDWSLANSVTIPYVSRLSFWNGEMKLICIGAPNYGFPGLFQELSVPALSVLHTRQTHTSPVVSAAYHPNGLLLVTGSQFFGQRLMFWDTLTATLLRSIPATGDSVRDVRFTRNGTYVVCADGDRIAIYRSSDGGFVNGWVHTPIYAVYSVDVNPSNTLVASCSQDATLRFWSFSSGALVRNIPVALFSLEFSPDGTLLAGGGAGQVFLYRTSDFTLARTITGMSGRVFKVRFSSDGTLLLTASEDGRVRIWRVSDGSLIRTFIGHTGAVSHADWSPDGSLVWSASPIDKTIRVWNASTGNLIATYDGEAGEAPRTFALSPTGDSFAVGRDDGAIYVAEALPRFVATNLTVARGLPLSGGLPEVQSSDNAYLVVRPWLVFSTMEPPVQLQFTYTTQIPTQRIKVRWEVHANITQVNEVLEAFNFQTQSWVTVNQGIVPTSDIIREADVPSGSEFVNPATGEIRLRLKYHRSGISVIFPWIISVDEVVVFAGP